MLTKQDRQALWYRRESTMCTHVDYDQEAGWIHPPIGQQLEPERIEGTDRLGSPVSHSDAVTEALEQQAGRGTDSKNVVNLLPKSKRRNFKTYFDSFNVDGQRETAFDAAFRSRSTSTHLMPPEGTGLKHFSDSKESVQAARRGGKLEQLSWLEDKLERTLHWNPHAAGVVGRTAGMAFGRVKTPRLEKASRVKRRSGHDARDKCPMPSALCQNRNTPVAPDKLTTITYRQILAVLAPDAKCLFRLFAVVALSFPRYFLITSVPSHAPVPCLS